jgi:putative inorganic carbon (HCO3(-)) transporter
VRRPPPAALALLCGLAAAWLGTAALVQAQLNRVALLAALLALTLLVYHRTALLVPLIVAAAPLEISKLWIPVLKSSTPWFGYEVSLLDAGRLAVMLAAAVVAARTLVRGRLLLPRTPLLYWSAGLVLFAASTVLYSFDPAKGRNEAIRLLFNFVLMLVVATIARTTARVHAAALTWVVVAALLSVLALGQYALGVSLWNPFLQQQAFRRINATFLDPNIFASFLNAAAAFGVGLLAARGERVWPWLLTLALLLGGLAVTFSRSGWIAFAAMALLAGLAFARSRRALQLFAAFATAGLLLLLAAPAALARLENLGSIESTSVRPFLISVGLLMFAEQPLTGLGIGSFSLAVRTAYAYAYPYGYYISASHTSFVTTAAELGVPGLLLTAGVLATATVQAYRIAVDSALPARWRALARGLLLALFTLVVAGQTTGALFEEPYVWIVLGLLVGLRVAVARELADGRPGEPRAVTGPVG